MHSIVFAFGRLMARFLDAAPPFLLLFLVLGLVKRRSIPYNKGEFFTASVILSHLGILFLVSLSYGYLSKRHALPLVGLCLPWMAAGLCEMLSRLEGWTRSGKRQRLSHRTVVFIGLGALFLGLLPKTLKPQRDQKIVWQQVGLWLKAQDSSHPPVILGRIPQVAFYADGRHVHLREEHYGRIAQLAREEGIDYLILRKEPEELAGLLSPQELASWEPAQAPAPPEGLEDEELIVFHLKNRR